MTKQQTIKKLETLGVSNIVLDGKFCIYATLPSGERGLFDPRDLLRTLTERQQALEDRLIEMDVYTR